MYLHGKFKIPLKIQRVNPYEIFETKIKIIQSLITKTHYMYIKFMESYLLRSQIINHKFSSDGIFFPLISLRNLFKS